MRSVFVIFALLLTSCVAAPPGIGALRNQIRGSCLFGFDVFFDLLNLSCEKYCGQVCQVCYCFCEFAELSSAFLYVVSETNVSQWAANQ